VSSMIGGRTQADRAESESGTLRSAITLLALLAVTASLACGKVASSNESPGLATAESSSNGIGAPPINWDQPLGGATVSSVAAAAPYLSFSPVAPKETWFANKDRGR
jgi:hypothetical protein